MNIYRVPSETIASYLGDVPGDARFLLLRAKDKRWDASDVQSLLELWPAYYLSVWNFARVLGGADGRLGQEAVRVRADKATTAFGKAPGLQTYLKVPEEVFTLGEAGFVYRCLECDPSQAVAAKADLASMINYTGGLHQSGLFVFHKPQSSPSVETLNTINKFFKLIMPMKLKTHSSQQSWDQDLSLKQEALLSVVESFARSKGVILIPLQNEDVEISLLAIGSETVLCSDLTNHEVLTHIKAALWEVGLFI